ncbi:DMT family transporter [Vallicoccus soli]|uniref:DMT family transporter n=1 Tax=Vallicoccus soli TaxID=2339232 RepID=UPI001401FE2E|nr:DMT family transporter [Vallicoccus soli]
MRTRTAGAGGALLVTAGAVLWGTDALFRSDPARELDAATVVLWEHVVLVAVTGAALPGAVAVLRRAGWRAVLAVAVIGVGASAVATLLFTQAFRDDLVTPVLLQKAQPLVAVLAAWLLLGERPGRAYGPFLLAGLAGAWLIAFRDPLDVSVAEARPALLGLGAAVLWALGTVLGRYLAPSFAPRQLTALRFAGGLVGAAAMAALLGADLAVRADQAPTIAALALVPGLLALLLYYRGLRTTPAMVATLCELAFPLTAALVPVLFLGADPLSGTQVLGVALAAAVVVGLSVAGARPRTRVVEAPPRTPVPA